MHPPTTNHITPYDLNKHDFLRFFGNIFEKSPWIAERTYDFEISPTMNSIVGLYAALRYQFRVATRKEKIRVILEHPYLAGKLAQTKKLTSESSDEQKSAGLDNLSADELKRFAELNKNYFDKFAGFCCASLTFLKKLNLNLLPLQPSAANF